jgi:two-component system, OmpR family, response regulator
MLVAIVDPEHSDAIRLETELDRSGITVETALTGGEALSRFTRRDLDAAIVHADLPDMRGVELIAALRDSGIWAPIVIVTASSEPEELVDALEAGADDYMVKPLAIPELVARLHALTRRAAAPRWAPLACGEVVLDADAHQVRVQGQPVRLSPRELALFELLMRRRGQLVQRDEILAEVFGYQFNPGTNVLDVHVAHLRRKLEGGGVTIETVRGAGFRLRSDVG